MQQKHEWNIEEKTGSKISQVVSMAILWKEVRMVKESESKIFKKIDECVKKKYSENFTNYVSFYAFHFKRNKIIWKYKNDLQN